VHGHTPEDEPVIRPNRIGIDTGAGRGGPLTCAVLDGDDVRFLQAKPSVETERAMRR
jgi:serine/threonine protein phosphatase 1